MVSNDSCAGERQEQAMPVPRDPKDIQKAEEKRARNKALFDQWLEECASIQEAVVESLLGNLHPGD